MPPKKRPQQDADSLSSAAATPPKRQRVSLACDSCRTAREKCDGARPSCQSCTSQNRACSYTPASRKRGVQTGYLRTIELSLAWVVEQVPGAEGALHRLLTQNGGAEGARILGTGPGTADKAGHQLYRKWNKSRIHKGIGRLLSNDQTPQDELSPESAATEDASPTANIDAELSPDFSLHGLDDVLKKHPMATTTAKLKLPTNWRHLVDVFFSYTYSWFPIVERQSITNTALTYPPNGLNLDMNCSALHAQLWAALAVASFQDAACPDTTQDGGPSPEQIYTIARRLIPSDDGAYAFPHTTALLLLSLALLGQSRDSAAWLLIGKASRLAMDLRLTTTHTFLPDDTSMADQETRVLAACYILELLVSLSLGHHQVTASLDNITQLSAIPIRNLADIEEQWNPLLGFGAAAFHSGVPLQSSAQPLASFQQLYAFCKLWGASITARLKEGQTAGRPIMPEDLVKSLNSRFAFCNSLIFGGSTPMVPSAYVLQSVFLAVTLDLVPGHRPSLGSNLIEVVESCLGNFGSYGTPPIMATLLRIIGQHGHNGRMHDHDKAKLNVAMDTLHAVWKTDVPGAERYSEAQSPGKRVGLPTNHRAPDPFAGDEISAAEYPMGHPRPPSIPGDGETAQSSSLQQGRERALGSYELAKFASNGGASPSTAQSLYPITPNLTFQSPTDGHAIPVFQTPVMPTQLVNYDAILEELGSIDCGDGIDVDPQFMANLGLAPGCDLGEMFQGDFGT